MKWNYIFASLLSLMSGNSFAATFDINDPNTLVIDSVISWDVFIDTTKSYNNILVTNKGVLNILGSPSIPNLTLSAIGDIEINGVVNIRDAGITFDMLNNFFLTGSITSNSTISIQSPSITLTDIAMINTSFAGTPENPGLTFNSDVIIGAQGTYDITYTAGSDLYLSSGEISIGTPIPTFISPPSYIIDAPIFLINPPTLSFINITAVPLPASLWLMLSGMFALMQISVVNRTKPECYLVKD